MAERIIFAADHPLVRNGTYDEQGYTPNERRAQHRKRSEGDTMAKRASTIDRKLSTPDTPAKPRQADLPGTEDRAIQPLEDIAAAYADVRDRRIALNTEEAALKGTALTLMHKFNKTIYRHDGIEIRIVPGEEDVKVKVKKADDGVEEVANATTRTA